MTEPSSGMQDWEDRLKASIKDGSSYCHEVVSQYKRWDYSILQATGFDNEIANEVAKCCLQKMVEHGMPQPSTHRAEFLCRVIEFKDWPQQLHVWEIRYNNHIAGVALLADNQGDREWFAHTLLKQKWPRLDPYLQSHIANVSQLEVIGHLPAIIIRAIVRLFEIDLLYQIPGSDGWAVSGKAAFIASLKFFIDGRIPILLTLPAFPCKGTKLTKTMSQLPDGADFEGLYTLRRFCQRVRCVYAPGCVIDIVSDGHVLSDCIGTDDDQVGSYTAALRAMAFRVESLFPNFCSTCRTTLPWLSISSLTDVLFPEGDTIPTSQPLDEVQHPVVTSTTEVVDDCRARLMHGFRSSTAELRNVVQTKPEHSLTALHRKFARDIFDDLKTLTSTSEVVEVDVDERARNADRIAFQMLLRRQALSNLLELIEPRHIKLSIYAYENTGPEFGIRLLPPEKYRYLGPGELVGDVALGNAVNSDMLMHQAHSHVDIPSQWHSVLVEVYGSSKVYVCNASAIKAELKRRNSRWSAASQYDANHARGGRYVLYSKAMAPG